MLIMNKWRLVPGQITKSKVCVTLQALSKPSKPQPKNIILPGKEKEQNSLRTAKHYTVPESAIQQLTTSYKSGVNSTGTCRQWISVRQKKNRWSAETYSLVERQTNLRFSSPTMCFWRFQKYGERGDRRSELYAASLPIKCKFPSREQKFVNFTLVETHW